MPMMSDSELQEAMRDFDPREPRPNLTPEERQRAMHLFLEEMRHTDEATEAEIADGIDQMMEHIYSSRNPPEKWVRDPKVSNAA
jgi:hypothetical protein